MNYNHVRLLGIALCAPIAGAYIFAGICYIGFHILNDDVAFQLALFTIKPLGLFYILSNILHIMAIIGLVLIFISNRKLSG